MRKWRGGCHHPLRGCAFWVLHHSAQSSGSWLMEHLRVRPFCRDLHPHQKHPAAIPLSCSTLESVIASIMNVIKLQRSV